MASWVQWAGPKMLTQEVLWKTLTGPLELTKLDYAFQGAMGLMAYPGAFKVVKLLGSGHSPIRNQLP